MKSVVDAQDVLVLEDNTSNGKRSASIPSEISAVSRLLEQGKFCKDLYLSLGVQATGNNENSEEDVESILEEMSRLQTGGEVIDGTLERNIDDILKEAESLLDDQQLEDHSLSRSSNFAGENLLFSSCEYPEACSLSNLDLDSAISSHQDSCPPFCDSLRNPSQILNSTYTKQDVLEGSENNVYECHDSDLNIANTKKDFSAKDLTVNRLNPPHIVGTPLEVTYQRIHEQIRREMDGSLGPHLTGDFPDLKLSMPIPGVESPSIDIPSCFSLEQEFLEERKRCLKLKADLDWLKKQHEREVAELRHGHEGQLLQVREECSSNDEKDCRIQGLEREVQSQERIIAGYQLENEKMCAELKEIKRALFKLMALLKTDRDS